MQVLFLIHESVTGLKLQPVRVLYEMINGVVRVVQAIKPCVLFGKEQSIVEGVKGRRWAGFARKDKEAGFFFFDLADDFADHLFFFYAGFLIKGPFKKFEDIFFGYFFVLNPFFIFFYEGQCFFLGVMQTAMIAFLFGFQGIFFEFYAPFCPVVRNTWAEIDFFRVDKDGPHGCFRDEYMSALGTFFCRHIVEGEKSVLAFDPELGDGVFVFGLVAFLTDHDVLITR